MIHMEVKFFLSPAPVKQQIKSEKNFVTHVLHKIHPLMEMRNYIRVPWSENWSIEQ